MFKILLKKQMTEIFRGYFYDAKKNKKRSLFSTIMFIIIYLAIMIGVLGGMFTYLSAGLCEPLTTAGMGWLYFIIMGMIAIALGAFGSIFNTYSGLYLSKDNDMLLSLPIPTGCIVAARLTSVYLLGLLYSAVVMVPAVIVYWIEAPINISIVIGSIFLIIIISAVILVLSCVLGWCVAKLSLKLKNKSFVTVFLSLAFFALYYFVYFKAQSVIQDLIMNAAIYGQKVKDSAYPLYLFGKIAEGDWLAIGIFAVIVALICIFTFWILSRSFIGIATSTASTAKKKYKEKHVTRKSISSALLAKEFGRFTSSPNYMLNCTMGSVFLIIISGALIIKGGDFAGALNQFYATGMDQGFIVAIIITIICVTAAMNDMVVPSVSLEGKSIWIGQSLPVEPWNILSAKLMVQILVTGIPVILCEACCVVLFDFGIAEKIMICIIPLIFTVLIALFGLFLGIKMPNLTWTSELAPIKRGINVMIAMFGGAALGMLIIAVYYLIKSKIDIILYLGMTAAVFIVAAIILYTWLKKKGAQIYRFL